MQLSAGYVYIAVVESAVDFSVDAASRCRCSVMLLSMSLLQALFCEYSR